MQYANEVHWVCSVHCKVHCSVLSRNYSPVYSSVHWNLQCTLELHCNHLIHTKWLQCSVLCIVPVYSSVCTSTNQCTLQCKPVCTLATLPLGLESGLVGQLCDAGTLLPYICTLLMLKRNIKEGWWSGLLDQHRVKTPIKITQGNHPVITLSIPVINRFNSSCCISIAGQILVHVYHFIILWLDRHKEKCLIVWHYSR